MFHLIQHIYRLFVAWRRERRKRHMFAGRSPHWRVVEKAHIAKHGTCAACGTKKRLQVHHKVPFHTDPKLELDPNNLITLCMAWNECHIRIGHGDNFHFYNPHVEHDAALVLEQPRSRKMVEEAAKKGRLVNEGGA